LALPVARFAERDALVAAGSDPAAERLGLGTVKKKAAP
jgi:hypothetical protein